jgi:eukaryotic-like serine/threonine-protein kinase
MHAVDFSRDQCPSCGAKLPAGVSAKECTPCLLRLALDLARDPALDADGLVSEADQSEATAGRLPEAPGIFAGYELIELIGRGAMGVVFKARQIELDRLIALKVLDLAHGIPSNAAKRFRMEASAAAGLRHPCIVTIHEVGTLHGLHYLAMDLVDGPTLGTLVAAQRLSAERAAMLIASVADAIHCAHEHGILHRDLKPSNILVDVSGQPRVADFGLAKRMDMDVNMTIPGEIMGSPNYMSPEQARGAVLGRASDVHALGAVLYHCLSGQPPFLGQTIPDTLHRVIHGEPLALRQLVAGVPGDLDTITLKCLQKDPAKRYPDASALADDLRRFLRREPIRARPAGRPERLWRWCRRRPAIASLTAATAFLVLSVAIGSPIATLRIRAQRERAEGNLYAAEMNLAHQALANSNSTQVRALLERHRPAPGQTDRRGFEWRYLWTKSERDDREILRDTSGKRHRHIVTIPGGNLIAVGNTVSDIGSSAREVFTLPSECIAMAFDPVAGVLLSGGRSGLVATSIATGKSDELLTSESVSAVALSGDRRWMATGGTEYLRLWTRHEGSWREIAQRPREFRAWFNSRTLAFSPDGSSLVSGTGMQRLDRCRLELWSVPALEPQLGLSTAPMDTLSLEFSSDGRSLVTGGWSGRIRVWNLDTMKEANTGMGGHLQPVTEVTFSPNDPNILASTGFDKTVRLWNVHTGTELVALQGPLDMLSALTFTNAGRTLLSLDKGGRISAWDASTRRPLAVLIARGPSTLPLGFSADSTTMATIDEAGGLRFWNTEQRSELEAKKQRIDLTGVSTDFQNIAPAITRDLGTLAIGMEDGRLQFWDLTSRTAHIVRAHAKPMRNLAFSPNDARLATVDDNGVLKLWNVASRTLLAETTIPRKLANGFNAPLAWSADGRTIAVASATTIMLHESESGRLVRTLDPEGLVVGLRFSPDDRMLVSAQQDLKVSFWDARSGRLLDRIPTSHQLRIHNLRFSPDGRTLATAVDQVKLWNVATRQEVVTLRGHERNIFGALFSPNGNVLVTADYEGAVRLWSAPPLEAIDGHGR